MRVTLYDAGEGQRDGRPLEGVPSVDVQVQSGWWVADVLEAGGHNPYSSFALLTPEIEADLGSGELPPVHASDLFGIDDRGALKFQGGDHVSWDEFLRATEAGLYRGDPTRLVVYPYGVAGGLEPDGLWEAVRWLFENRDVAVNALEEVAKVGGGLWALDAGRRRITGLVRQQIARRWRAQGFTAPRIRNVLGRLPQWDPGVFAKMYQISEPEACLALTNAGYEEGEHGLWRPAHTDDGRQRRKGLEEIEQRAYANIEDGWSDDFPLDEEMSEGEDKSREARSLQHPERTA